MLVFLATLRPSLLRYSNRKKVKEKSSRKYQCWLNPFWTDTT